MTWRSGSSSRQAYLDQVRKRLAEAANPELGDKADVEIIRDIEPAAHPVDGEELFHKLVEELTGLVIFDKDDTERPAGAIATALWVISTHCYEPFPAARDPPTISSITRPRLMISAGTIRSGKTRLLETTACLGRRVLRASSLSSAAVVPGLRAIPSPGDARRGRSRPPGTRTATP